MDPRSLPSKFGRTPQVTVPVGSTLAVLERLLIEATLRHLRGNKTRAAETLGISLKTLYNRLNDYSVRDVIAGAYSANDRAL